MSLSSSLALARLQVEYSGHTYAGLHDVIEFHLTFQTYSAHAALSPWEGTNAMYVCFLISLLSSPGQNALDAAVLAYTNISLLRQQLKPTHRVHGVFRGESWVPNGMYFLYSSAFRCPHTLP